MRLMSGVGSLERSHVGCSLENDIVALGTNDFPRTSLSLAMAGAVALSVSDGAIGSSCESSAQERWHLGTPMAAEAERGCGFRKLNATYVEGDPGGLSCGRLPVPLQSCPLCDHRPVFTRGIQRVTPTNVLHAAAECPRSQADCDRCPLGKVLQQETAALAWVGEKWYSPASFTEEANRLGASKRVSKIPKWFEVGKTWMFLAHSRVFSEPCSECQGTPTPLEQAAAGRTHRSEDCPECDGEGTIWNPGIFYAFVPKRLVKILADNAHPRYIAQAEERGYTVLLVPASDPDHQ